MRLVESLLTVRSMALVLGGGLALVFATACGGGSPTTNTGIGDEPTPTPNPTSTSTTTVVPPAPCTDGTRRACKYNLPTHGGIVSCFHGIQICAEGDWGDCIDGTLDAGIDGADAATVDPP